MRVVWITVIRGVMAIILGLALMLLQRDRAPGALANFMGVYWILNGVVSLRLGQAAIGVRRRAPIAAGVIAIVTGASVLLVDVSTTYLLSVLGLVMALTGIIHVFGGFDTPVMVSRRWRPGLPLGILEIGLGLDLLLTATDPNSFPTWLAGLWAVLGGSVLIAEALATRQGLLAAPAASDGALSEPAP